MRKIIKVQAFMRAVMAKIRRKRGGNFGRSRRRGSKTAADMTKDEAALAIQKSKDFKFKMGETPLRYFSLRKSNHSVISTTILGYRGYSVRKEYGLAPNKPRRFQCSTIQEEAAHTIQYFWRKWKGKSLFQQLLLYRAEKQQTLTYFCQQVKEILHSSKFDPL